MPVDDFSRRVLDWFDRHGRKGLPWQSPRDAYRVWVSEIMLQQTQVGTVIPYFERFMASFPAVRELADADADEVLRLWAGLGYYARARNLHRAAGMVRDRHGGQVPDDFDALMALPGIGRSTAGAILAQAWGQRHAILDGNVKRLLARYHAVPGWPGDTAVARLLWDLSTAHTPEQRVAEYTQAVMDLGAMVCTRRRPLCERCPVAADCVARATGRVGEYPAPRPRRQRPRRRTRMLILLGGAGEVLLERRPPAGIWGGLWCFPEIDQDEPMADWCRRRLGRPVREYGELSPIRHGFTHFELDIYPVLAVSVGDAVGIMAGTDRVWYNVRESVRPAVPKPVATLFDRLGERAAQGELWPIATETREEDNDGKNDSLRETGQGG